MSIEETTETPYEIGRRHGAWTAAQVQECGWESPEACLAQMEQGYQDKMNNLSDMYQRDPESAKQHAEYLEGLIASARSTLRALMSE